MKKIIFCTFLNSIFFVNAQIKWINLNSLYQPLPFSFHIYKSTDSLDGKPNVIYYAVADIEDKNLEFTTDTTYKRRLTPAEFSKKINNFTQNGEINIYNNFERKFEGRAMNNHEPRTAIGYTKDHKLIILVQGLH